MLDYLWICLNMPEYSSISMNIAEYVLMNFFLQGLIVTSWVLERLVTCFNKVCSLKEHEVTILYFCRDSKRIKIFTSKISNLLFPLGVEDWELWIWIYYRNIWGLPPKELIARPLVCVTSIQGRILKYAERKIANIGWL